MSVKFRPYTIKKFTAHIIHGNCSVDQSQPTICSHRRFPSFQSSQSIMQCRISEINTFSRTSHSCHSHWSARPTQSHTLTVINTLLTCSSMSSLNLSSPSLKCLNATKVWIKTMNTNGQWLRRLNFNWANAKRRKSRQCENSRNYSCSVV